jgi:hypothetical protein
MAESRMQLELQQLDKMDRRDLQRRYGELLGTAPVVANSEQLQRKIARKLQTAEEGELPQSAIEYASAIAREVHLRVRVGANLQRRTSGLPEKTTVTTVASSGHDSRLPMPGGRIIKQFQGRSIVVHILDGSFEMDGRRFNWLSAIAKDITGTKWNGYLFFGLTKENANGSR